METSWIHHYEIPVKGMKRKTVFHFSDVHLSLYDKESTEEEASRAKIRTKEWESNRKHFATGHNEPYEEQMSKTAKEQFETLIETACNGDLVLLAGDITDYFSGANTRYLEQMLKKCSVPYLYVSGNHEFLEVPSDNRAFEELKKPFQIIEQEDVTVFGLNNSNRVITSEQIDALKQAFQSGKPVMIVMHIPVMTAENEAVLKLCGEYFYINYEGAPKENFEFITILKENAESVIGVFAGHLHFGNVSEIAPGVTQYVSSQGLLGNCNRYVIGDE